MPPTAAVQAARRHDRESQGLRPVRVAIIPPIPPAIR